MESVVPKRNAKLLKDASDSDTEVYQFGVGKGKKQPDFTVHDDANEIVQFSQKKAVAQGMKM